jgi:hypothetical protein
VTPAMTEYVVASGETWLCPPWAIVPTARITVRTCRSCGARVAWLKTRKTGSLAPVNSTGESHFSDCPQAPSWRKPKATREEAGL